MIPILIALIAMTASSRVDSVIVYPYQVQVVRTASVSVSGPGEIVFPGLPGAIQDNTVRIKARGLRIGEVQVKQGYMAEPTPEVRRLELAVRQLEDELAALDNEAVVLKAREDFLNSIKLGAPEMISKDLAQGKVSVESWRAALGFMADELARVKARSISLAREHQEKSQKVDAARQEYAAARSAIENRKDVRFDYDGAAGDYDVQLSYIIPNAASWAPYYELRARPDNAKVEVSYFAKLEQRSGENWDRVKVVLSTTTPATDIAAPQPSPWAVSFEEDYGGRSMTKMDKAEAAPAPVTDGILTGAADEEQRVQAVETGISLQYAIPGRVSLASGEPAKKLSLTTTELPAEFEYYALPRMREQAFLTGKLVNSSAFVLLAGQANTYVGDEYTGSTWLANIAPEESTELSFGVDERIKVKRELVKSFKSKVGLFGKTERMSYVFKTTIENYLSKPVAVKVVEQVPVSQQSDIKVSVTKVQPNPMEENKDEGTYTWKPTIESQGKFTVNLEFSVDSPAGRRLSGLY